MNEVKSARKKLEDKLVVPNKTAAPVAKETEKKFVRVAIQEESDEEEGEEKKEDKGTFQVGKEEALIQEVPPTTQQKVEVLDSKENTPNWWKQSSESLNPDDFKPITPVVD